MGGSKIIRIWRHSRKKLRLLHLHLVIQNDCDPKFLIFSWIIVPMMLLRLCVGLAVPDPPLKAYAKYLYIRCILCTQLLMRKTAETFGGCTLQGGALFRFE